MTCGARMSDGRSADGRTARAPILRGGEGVKRLDLFRSLIKKWTAVTWVPASVTPLQRALLQQWRQSAKAGA